MPYPEQDPRVTFQADQDAAQSEAAERDTQAWTVHMGQELAKAQAIEASAEYEKAKANLLNAASLACLPVALGVFLRLLRRPRG